MRIISASINTPWNTLDNANGTSPLWQSEVA